MYTRHHIATLKSDPLLLIKWLFFLIGFTILMIRWCILTVLPRPALIPPQSFAPSPISAASVQGTPPMGTPLSRGDATGATPLMARSDALEPVRLERQPQKVTETDGFIDVNHASLAELQRLPGIGPVLAQRIIDAREKGLFRQIEDLRRVSGIGVKRLEQLRPVVVVNLP